MTSLLDKFETVKVKEEDLLPKEITAACKAEQVLFDRTLQQLATSVLALNKMFEQEDHEATGLHLKVNERFDLDAHRGNKRYEVEIPYSSKEDKSLSYLLKEFSYSEPLVSALNQMDYLRKKFCRAICRIIRERFMIKFDDIDESDIVTGKYDKYATIIQYIKAKVGTIDFGGQAIKEWTDKFRSNVYTQEYISISGRTLNITSFIYFESGYSSGPKFRYKCDRIQSLEAVLCIFEKGEYLASYHFNARDLSDSVADFGSEYEMINGEKVEGVKFYKNSKIAIKFKSEKLLQEFYNLMDLGSLKVSRW